MPPVVLAAGVTAAGALAGSALSSRAAGKASEAQERSTAEALAFQRDQARRAEAAYRERWEQQQAMRNALLQRYGITLPDIQQTAMPQQGVPPGAVPRGGPMPQGAVPRGAGLTLQELAMRGKPIGGGYYGE